jgi:hypothetical protein
MPDHPTCIDCQTPAPSTTTSYTLISASFGWRITRKTAADGSRQVEWRCPRCWRAYKSGGSANASREQGLTEPPDTKLRKS